MPQLFSTNPKYLQAVVNATLTLVSLKPNTGLTEIRHNQIQKAGVISFLLAFKNLWPWRSRKDEWCICVPEPINTHDVVLLEGKVTERRPGNINYCITVIAILLDMYHPL